MTNTPPTTHHDPYAQAALMASTTEAIARSNEFILKLVDALEAETRGGQTRIRCMTRWGGGEPWLVLANDSLASDEGRAITDLEHRMFLSWRKHRHQDSLELLQRSLLASAIVLPEDEGDRGSGRGA